jgi:uncharacterized protein YcbX
MATQKRMVRYLTACRHDVAHLNGASPQDIASWVTAHEAEATTLYNETFRARLATDEADDGLDSAEAALVAVKKWAQGDLYRE